MPRTVTIELTRAEVAALWAMVTEGHNARVSFAVPPPKRSFARDCEAAYEKVREALNVINK